MEEELMEIGLSKNEIKVYLKLSEIGASSAYNISKKANLFKANTYDALKRLVEKGLVSQKTVEKKELYEASDPGLLLDLLDTKKEKISRIIPIIRIKQSTVQTETEVNVHKGADAFINLLYTFLEYKEPILIYGAPKEAYQELKYKIESFHKERIKRKIKMYHIYNFDATERIKTLKKMPYTPIKKLPELFDSKISTNICGDIVSFTTFTPSIKFIRIKDKNLANSYKNYFKILWANAKTYST